MNRIDIKALSTNQIYMGVKKRSYHYKKYEKLMLTLLPDGVEIPEGKLKIEYLFGYSSMASDVDNGIKAAQDIISKFYGFNDNRIYEVHARKVKVKKGDEYIKFKISQYEEN